MTIFKKLNVKYIKNYFDHYFNKELIAIEN